MAGGLLVSGYHAPGGWKVRLAPVDGPILIDPATARELARELMDIADVLEGEADVVSGSASPDGSATAVVSGSALPDGSATAGDPHAPAKGSHERALDEAMLREMEAGFALRLRRQAGETDDQGPAPC